MYDKQEDDIPAPYKSQPGTLMVASHKVFISPPVLQVILISFMPKAFASKYL
jgi:hypothetical protein